MVEIINSNIENVVVPIIEYVKEEPYGEFCLENLETLTMGRYKVDSKTFLFIAHKWGIKTKHNREKVF